MKNALFIAFRMLCFLVLTGKILNWFLKFSNETNQILNTVMFTLIGIAYIVMGYIWDDKFVKTIATVCGIYVIGMNFFAANAVLQIVGIVCILTPMLIARFHKESDTAEVEQSI